MIDEVTRYSQSFDSSMWNEETPNLLKKVIYKMSSVVLYELFI